MLSRHFSLAIRWSLPALLVASMLWISPLSGLPVQAGPNPPQQIAQVFLPVILKPGGQVQAPILKWDYGGCTSWCQTGWYSSPAVVNIDADPQAEIIAGFYDLVALDGATGAEDWRAPSEGRVWPGVALADLEGNGSLEIVVGRHQDKLTVYNLAGTELWSRYPFGEGEIRTLLVYDLDLDGQVEILVGSASGRATEQLSVYEPDGSVRPGWPARRDGEAGNGWGMYNQNAAAADLTADGFAEIIGPTDTHYITALDRDGNQLPAHSMYDLTYPEGPKVWSQVGVHVDHAVDLRGWANCGVEHRPNFAESAPVLYDLDGNGKREVIVVGNVYNCGTAIYTSLYYMPFIFNADRSRWAASGFDWTAIPAPAPGAAPLTQDWNTIESALPNPVIADLDGNGFPEILFASYDGRLHAYRLDKSAPGSWPFEVYDPAEGFFRFASEPAVADLNNDGQAEVIFTSWTQKGSHATGRLHIVDSLGNLLHEIDLPEPLGAWDWNGALAAPTLANVDLDADYEVVVLTAHAGVVVYDLPGSSVARILWGTGRGNFYRSGSK